MRPRRVLPNRTHPTVGDGRVAGPRNRQDRTHGSGSQPVCRRGQRPVVDDLCRASRRPGHHPRLRRPTSEVLPHRGARYTRADGVVLGPRLPASPGTLKPVHRYRGQHPRNRHQRLGHSRNHHRMRHRTGSLLPFTRHHPRPDGHLPHPSP